MINSFILFLLCFYFYIPWWVLSLRNHMKLFSTRKICILLASICDKWQNKWQNSIYLNVDNQQIFYTFFSCLKRPCRLVCHNFHGIDTFLSSSCTCTLQTYMCYISSTLSSNLQRSSVLTSTKIKLQHVLGGYFCNQCCGIHIFVPSNSSLTFNLNFDLQVDLEASEDKLLSTTSYEIFANQRLLKIQYKVYTFIILVKIPCVTLMTQLLAASQHKQKSIANSQRSPISSISSPLSFRP